MEPKQLSPPSVRAPARKALVLLNERAGSVAPGDGEKLAASLPGLGIEQYALIGAGRMSPKLFRRAREFDVIVVLGGDGTARAAAAMAPEDAPPLILLPGGTLNMLPKALYGELSWPDALAAALERGAERRLPCGIANDERFFVAALFGAPTVLARAREAAREGKLLKAAGRVRSYVRRAFSGGLRARAEDEWYRSAEAVGALLPSFGGGLHGDGLEWVRLKANHFADLARVSVRALGPGWRDDPAVALTQTRRGEIVSRGFIPATLDGEPRNFFSRVRVRYDARGPRVLALQTEGAKG